MARSPTRRRPHGEQIVDAELARVSRSAGALRHALGAGLEALARAGGHHDLGFSSLEAYALERCERSARWVQESRALARRLEALPSVRTALQSGDLGFSMAQALAKVATPENEATWLTEAARRTVREIRRLVKDQDEADAVRSLATRSPDDDPVTLSVVADREDAWLFECARMIVKNMDSGTDEHVMEALLAEGVTAMFSMIRRESWALDDVPDDAPQRQWEAELARWRDEAEARCETNFVANDVRAEPACGFVFDGDAVAIDAELRRVAAVMANRDVEIGRLAEAFWTADGWRRLGYATESQYARERLGASLSSIEAKRRLARKCAAMPRLEAAIAGREVGYEAARLVASTATAETVDAWIARARERTVKFLREEVDAAQMLGRLGARDTMQPPSDETIRELHELESAVVGGSAFQGDGPQISARLAELFEAFDRRRAPRDTRSKGRVTLRFRISAGLRRHYRWVDRLYERHRPARMGFLRFLCLALIDSWKHAMQSKVEYAHIYERDRYRCTSPVCVRRDVTPHHLVFRSKGGGESPENLTGACVWCHLEGIHLGRLSANPPASSISWVIGRNAHTIVHGRRRVRAA